MSDWDMRAVARTADLLGHHFRLPDGVGCTCGWRRTTRAIDHETHVAAELLAERPWEEPPES